MYPHYINIVVSGFPKTGASDFGSPHARADRLHCVPTFIETTASGFLSVEVPMATLGYRRVTRRYRGSSHDSVQDAL